MWRASCRWRAAMCSESLGWLPPASVDQAGAPPGLPQLGGGVGGWAVALVLGVPWLR